jgi:ammonia channel protein AmtB
MFSEWLTHGKPSVLGIASGAVAGLVAITPAPAPPVPMGALAIGLAAGVICFFSLHQDQTRSVMTTRWTCSACMRWAASSAPS